jgi:hypothetical protein
LLAQCITSSLICYLLEINNWTRFVFLAYVLPVMAKIVGMPPDIISNIHSFSIIFTLLLLVVIIFNNLHHIFETNIFVQVKIR